MCSHLSRRYFWSDIPIVMARTYDGAVGKKRRKKRGASRYGRRVLTFYRMTGAGVFKNEFHNLAPDERFNGIQPK